MHKKRQLIYFKEYFWDFFNKQSEKTKDKIDYVLFLITVAEHIPRKFFEQKTQKTPAKEIEKAMQIMKEYFEYKQKG